MNDFLAKYGYFLEKNGHIVYIYHKASNYGCIHIIFVLLLIPSVVISFYVIWFSAILALLAMVYLLEVEKRRKNAKRTLIDFKNRELVIEKKNKKKNKHYPFSEALSVVSTSEHIGGYASADRETTEEYRREVSVLFKNSDLLTIFSFVSDEEDEEPEVKVLVNWLEKGLNLI